MLGASNHGDAQSWTRKICHLQVGIAVLLLLNICVMAIDFIHSRTITFITPLSSISEQPPTYRLINLT